VKDPRVKVSVTSVDAAYNLAFVWVAARRSASGRISTRAPPCRSAFPSCVGRLTVLGRSTPSSPCDCRQSSSSSAPDWVGVVRTTFRLWAGRRRRKWNRCYFV